MIGELTNHLWQSTLVVVAAGLLTALFRKDRAEVRYWLWFSASCKFLLPFALLTSLGNHITPISVTRTFVVPSASFGMEQFAQPFRFSQTPASHPTESLASWVRLVSLAMWAGGFGLIGSMRYKSWRRIRAAVASSIAIDTPAAMEVRSSRGLLEPGVVGLFRPILLLPTGIVERLTPKQLRAVLSHEACHIRRKDNLTSAIHMVVEAVFWFHPLTWWIGARLVQEREQACDEAVLRLGNAPADYAEGILQVCRNYWESPLSCVSGVTGSNLKKRIQAILAGTVARDLTFAKKAILTAAGIAIIGVPILAGSFRAPRLPARSGMGGDASIFEAASIRSCPAFRRSTPESWSPGKLRTECTTIDRLIQQAYGLFETGHVNPGSSVTVTGGPAWAASDLYEIDAKAHDSKGREVMNGPMMQRFLEHRFRLKVHRETRERPVYELTAAPGGAKLEPFEGICRSRDFDDPPSGADCGTARGYGKGFDLKAATMADLCAGFLVLLDRPVVDKSGMTGRFNMRVDLSGEDPALLEQPRSLPALSDPLGTMPPPVRFESAKTAVKTLGLNLESASGPGEFIVIDRIERPSVD